jgi:hypothetical protein
MSRKHRAKHGGAKHAGAKQARAGQERTQAPGQRAVAVTSPTIVWEAHVFGSGGYQTASRFLLQGVIEAGSDVDVRPLWEPDTMRRLND